MKKPKPSIERYKEFNDRLLVVGDIIDKHLLRHPVSKLDTDVSKELNKILTTIFEVDQNIKEKLYNGNHT